VQRLDPQVAVDQHQPLAFGDRDHRHLLSDLGDRRDQPPAPGAVTDPQIFVPQLEPVQVDFHAATLPQLPKSLHLGLRDGWGMSAEFTSSIKHLDTHLGLHVGPDYSDYSRKDYASFHPHLVLHDIPGHSRDRRRRIRGGRHPHRGRRRLGRVDRLAPSSIAVVVRI